MECLLFLAVLAVVMIILFVREAMQAKARQKRFAESLYQGFGKLPDRKYSPESYAHIAGFYKKHPVEHPIDDITWNDLNMDDVFQRLNYCLSAAGEEYLYYMLRDAGAGKDELERLEKVVSWFADHADERVRTQMMMRELGHTGKFSLYDYIDHLDDLGERSNLRHHAANALYLPLIVLLPFKLPLALTGIFLLIGYQVFTYFKEKGETEPYIVSFAYLMRLITVCEKLCAEPIPPFQTQLEEMRKRIRSLKGIRSGSYWVFSSGSSGSGGPMDTIQDYFRMIFHIDLIIFNRMLRELRAHLADADALIAGSGFLEAAISVGYFRASLKNGWCVPKLEENGDGALAGITLENGYHPLLEEPVKNTILTEKGILLTGSNASGKSTFLKTVALNAVLAQTIHTCTAEEYRAPLFQIYSSMALRDNLYEGESYYIVEIKALKRILDAVGNGRILCFVDEVLRGTNTVERIAASAEILRSLAEKDCLCFAATHDIELTELLQEKYENYHFEEVVRDGDLFFPYRLLPGRASTRNAIRLLEIMGYGPEIVEQAVLRAEAFLKNGVWIS